MFTVRRSQDRGKVDQGWLQSNHTFSFGSYYDPQHMGFAHLKVINEDVIAPGQGFSTHSHKDMEILSYVAAGELQHKDSLGNGSLIRPGDVQTMSAGTGVTHSEFNPSAQTPTHFLQIWVAPRHLGLPPSYGQAHFEAPRRINRWCLLASPDGRQGSLTVHQNFCMYGTLLETKKTLEVSSVLPQSHLWLQIVGGQVELQGAPLEAGDGVAILGGNPPFELVALCPSELILFEMW